MTQPTVGFAGLGLMGQGFARRLIETGHRVLGFDIDPARRAEAEGLGVTIVANAASLAAADFVLICVVDSKAVEDVVCGPAGLAGAAGIAGKTVVDHSTTEAETTARVGAALEAAGAAFVDAPVSGGPDAARTGTLAIMAGGKPRAIAAITPLMQHIGAMTHMGPVGTGQATKLVNQTLVLTNYCVLAEALRLAEAHGVDTTKIPQALAGGHAGSNLLPVAFPRMAEGDFAPRGYARQVLKDLEMLQAAAKTHHVAMPMAAQALTLYRLLVASGRSEMDAGAVATLYPRASPKP